MGRRAPAAAAPSDDIHGAQQQWRETADTPTEEGPVGNSQCHRRARRELERGREGQGKTDVHPRGACSSGNFNRNDGSHDIVPSTACPADAPLACPGTAGVAEDATAPPAGEGRYYHARRREARRGPAPATAQK